MSSHLEISDALHESDLIKCWLLVRELRPHVSQEEFIRAVGEMRQEGYTAVFIHRAGEPVAYAGFRCVQMLFSGKIIYIDDLVTAPLHRGRGYGSQLLDHIVQVAKDKDLQGIHLDSGYLKNEAHRLYLNKGFVLRAHHFALDF